MRNMFRFGAPVAALAAAFVAPSMASAHTIYQLQGNQWAIICDNGSGFSFSGSQGGATEVAGLLCGEAVVNPGGGTGISVGTLAPADRYVRRHGENRYTLLSPLGGSGGPAAFAGYPPHGYPCLGCEPCPGNPTEFCDTTGVALQAHPDARKAGWVVGDSGRLIQLRPKTNVNR